MAQILPPYPPPRLYRYRKVSSPRLLKRELDAIAQGHLWCSNYSKLNDPMEGTYGASTWLTEQPTFPELVRDIRSGKQAVGICCFSDTFYSELMWAHYAQNYSGICVGYSTSRLLQGLDDSVQIVRVAYGDMEPRIGKAENCPQLAVRKILSHKKSCWLYEREWRLMTEASGSLPIAVEGAVKVVYLGSRMKEVVRIKLANRLTKMGINVHAVKVSGYEHDYRPYRP